jgi:sugar O-acyltransferase (sialic acid O-acetyltransferase NeuD family)
MKRLLLIGGGGHCRSCIDVIEATGQFEIAGIVERSGVCNTESMAYPILGNDDDLPRLVKQYYSAIITVGQIRSAGVRVKLFEGLKELKADLPVIVSPQAYVSRHAHIASGTIVMHRALINANARIGENCIINSQALVEHDANVEPHCHISTGAKVNGGARIEMGTFIGSGAVIREGIRIGINCLIGAGAVVLADLPAGTTFRIKA